MKTILKREVISDIFAEFPQLNRIWVKGDLETFYDSEFVIEGCVHKGAFVSFIYQHFKIGNCFIPVVFSESFMREKGYLDDSYLECTREDYV